MWEMLPRNYRLLVAEGKQPKLIKAKQFPKQLYTLSGYPLLKAIQKSQ